MIVLKKLYEKDGLNQNDLAFITLRDKSTLTRLLSKMQKKGYITREQSPEDGRVNHVFITPIGSEVYRKTRPVIKEVIELVEHGISREELDQMIQTLQKIQFNLTSQQAYL
jgi:DNA-binding MarR family transcriptional regulator